MLQIDWEESAIANRVCVRLRVDEELDNLKHIYNGIDSVLVRLPRSPLTVIFFASNTSLSQRLPSKFLRLFLRTMHPL